ncbi:MAG: hypothetical protein ACYS6K_20235 [Planctomycetota bacterium]|jgi:hypothetical protein
MKRKYVSSLWMTFTLPSILCILLSASTRANLLVYYAFNEGAGDTVRDVSGNGNNAIMYNMNDSAWVAGKEDWFGTCLALDGEIRKYL